MITSENPALDQLAQSCQEIGDSILSTEQLKNVLLSAAYKIPEVHVDTEGLKKALLIFEQALKLSDDTWISFEEVEASLEEIKPYISSDINETVSCEISAAKTPDNKIQQSHWKKILETILISMVAPFMIFGAEQIASREHNCKEEAYWSATEEYQQEDLAIKKRILELLEETQDASDLHSEIRDESHHTEQHIVDSSDSDVDIDSTNG